MGDQKQFYQFYESLGDVKFVLNLDKEDPMFDKKLNFFKTVISSVRRTKNNLAENL